MRRVALCALALGLAALGQPACKKPKKTAATTADAGASEAPRKAPPVGRPFAPRKPDPSLPGRVADLESSDPAVRLRAVRAFAKRPPEGDTADVSAMIALLDSKDPGVRLSAATALTYVKDAPSTDAPLVAAMRDRDKLVAFQALKAVARRRNPAALPGVLATLESKDRQRRGWAVVSLGKLGDPARPHWKRLLPRLSDEAPTIRLQAIRSIGRLGGADAIEPLVAQAPKANDMTRAQIKKALGDLAIDEAARAAALERIDAAVPAKGDGSAPAP